VRLLLLEGMERAAHARPGVRIKRKLPLPWDFVKLRLRCHRAGSEKAPIKAGKAL